MFSTTKIFLTAGLWLAVFAPALTNAESSSLPADDTPDTRRAAAEEYLKIVPVKELTADIAEKMAAKMKPEDGAKFRQMMVETLDVSVIEQAMKESMIRRFTVGEITALTRFYDLPEGRSVMKKMGDYMSDVMPVIQQQVLQAALKSGIIKPGHGRPLGELPEGHPQALPKGHPPTLPKGHPPIVPEGHPDRLNPEGTKQS